MEGNNDGRKSRINKSSFRYALYFIIYGSLWIVVSGLINLRFLENSFWVELAKGLFYVVVTSVIVFFLMKSYTKKTIKATEEATEARLKLMSETDKRLETEEELVENVALFTTIFNQAPVGIAVIGAGNIAINQKLENITGKSNSELLDYIKELPLTAKLTETDNWVKDFDYEYQRPDGRKVWLHVVLTKIDISPKKRYNLLCIVDDITEKRNNERDLEESERSKRVLLENLPGMAFRCAYDRDWTMHFVSGGCLDITGYPPESLLYNRERSYNDIISPEYRLDVWNECTQRLKKREKYNLEYEIITSSGARKWVFDQEQGIFDENGKIIAIEGLIIDITHRKNFEIKQKYLTEHDPLTGLYNRRKFIETVDDDLVQKPENHRAVLLVSFRQIDLMLNNFGYSFCENLIKDISLSLSDICGYKHRLYAISLDKFAVYITDYLNREEIIHLCNRIINSITALYSTKITGGSIGVLETGEHNCSAEEILKYAVLAGENCDRNTFFSYCFFHTKIEDNLFREARLKDELLKTAYENPENLYLQYQPILDIKTGLTSGFEALARYKSDTLGFVPPNEFIPIAEDTQLMIPLGKIIIRKALRFLTRLSKTTQPDTYISINISPMQLISQDFLSDVESIIAEEGANPQNIVFEITESVFSGNLRMINKQLDRIRALGIKIAIDDFGTGYSSLARVRELHFDCLKIDKYFIDKLLNLDERGDITDDIISMAHKLEHLVIAEGVEEEKQLNYLKKHDCDLIQGYYYSRPLLEEAALKMLIESNNSLQLA